MDNIKLMRTLIVLAAFILMSSAVMYQAVRVDGLVTGSGTDADPLSIDTTTYIATQYDISDKVSAGAASYVNAGGKSGGQTIIGGTGTTDDLSLQTTSGVGASGADMHFLVGNNGATEAMTILNDGKVGIGTNSPSYNLSVAGNGNTTMTISDANNSGTNKPKILFKRSRGTLSSPTGIQSGDYIAQILLNAHNGTNFEGDRRILQVDASENWGVSNGGFEWKFYTRANGTVGAPSERMRLGHDGTVTFYNDVVMETGTIQLKGYTVATLPTGTTGMTAYVTDATAPTYLATLTGGGSVTCPVFYDGSAWRSH